MTCPDYITDQEIIDGAMAADEMFRERGMSFSIQFCIQLATTVISAQCATAEAIMEAHRAYT